MPDKLGNFLPGNIIFDKDVLPMRSVPLNGLAQCSCKNKVARIGGIACGLPTTLVQYGAPSLWGSPDSTTKLALGRMGVLSFACAHVSFQESILML